MPPSRFVASLVIGTLLVPCAAPSGQTPSVKDVMRKVGAYAEAYGGKASIVVCTERYAQETSSTTGDAQQKRVTVAEFAIVRVEGAPRWLGFRDVIEVDGRSVGDRDDRLVRLLTSGDGGYDEARKISNESARFNIGRIERNFNVPTTTLFFFTPDNHARFKFTAKEVQPDGSWEIAFRETQQPTLIRTPDGKSVPSDGSIWVNPADGTVLRTLLKVSGIGLGSSSGVRGAGSIDVTYRRIEALDMWLPESMVERFDMRRSATWDSVSGRAAYTNYRQFQTLVRIK